MVVLYVQWQFWDAPRWLARTLFYIHQAIALQFSVAFMIRTLVAPWRKDQVSLQQGFISKIAMAFAWNLISRGIGMVIRLMVIIGWVIVEVLYLPLAISVWLILALAPLLIALLFVTGLSLVVSGLL